MAGESYFFLIKIERQIYKTFLNKYMYERLISNLSMFLTPWVAYQRYPDQIIKNYNITLTSGIAVTSG